LHNCQPDRFGRRVVNAWPFAAHCVERTLKGSGRELRAPPGPQRRRSCRERGRARCDTLRQVTLRPPAEIEPIDEVMQVVIRLAPVDGFSRPNWPIPEQHQLKQ
jgi:hypothetical protein